MSIRDTQAVFIHSLCDQLDEIKQLAGESADDLKEAGEAMTRVFMEQAAPQTMPAAIEEHVEGEIGGVSVHGYIDVRTTDGRIIDIKTRSANLGVTPAHRLQVATYAILHPEASGRATIATLTKTKTVSLCQDTSTFCLRA
jgi:CRISPR/Cas system-associated exonuclease Cas4 (RecB family)